MPLDNIFQLKPLLQNTPHRVPMRKRRGERAGQNYFPNSFDNKNHLKHDLSYLKKRDNQRPYGTSPTSFNIVLSEILKISWHLSNFFQYSFKQDTNSLEDLIDQ